ncbi:MAG: hypothetical protein ACFCU1_02245 [Sumerlaeia bacterium]
MKKKSFTEDQFAFALRQAEAGIPDKEVIRKMGVTEQMFYRRKKWRLSGRRGASSYLVEKSR